MKNFSTRLLVYLFIDIILFSICLWHLPSIFHRAKTPFLAWQEADRMTVEEITDPGVSGTLAVGDILLLWNNKKIEFFETLEFYSNFTRINETVRIVYQRNGSTYATDIRLIPYYSSIRYILIILFVGIVIFGVGIFILLNGPPLPSTQSLHWALVSLGVSVLMTTGILDNALFSSYLFETVFYVFYMMTVSQFLYFSTRFPNPKTSSERINKYIIFIPSFILITVLCFFRLRAIYFESLSDLSVFQELFDFFHLALFFYVGGSVFNFISAYRRSKTAEERLRLKWILWGIVIGASPFLLLSIGPQLFDQPELIQEEFTLVFFLVIPFSFAIAIVRYQFLNIDILINRTILYFILTLLIGVLYIFAVLVATSAISGEAVFDEYLFIIAIAFLIAISFNSLRSRLQKLINESFFSARENYRRAFEEMQRNFHKCLGPDELFYSMQETLMRYIPISDIHVVRMTRNRKSYYGSLPHGVEIRLSGKKASELVPHRDLYSQTDMFRDDYQLINYSQKEIHKQTGFSLFVPLCSDEGELLAILFCNPHKTKTGLIKDEVELLLTGSREASDVLQRLLLQERIILEREEKHRLQQINRLKSFFISSVSHDLKTPLTSIKMFAEILKSKKMIPEKQRSEFFSIIEGESERLTQLINNVLDFSKIEQGKKEYYFSQIDLNQVVERAMLSMKYQLMQHKFKTKVEFKENPILIMADENALLQVLINVISNAIKYSDEKKSLHITTDIRNSSAVIFLADKGIGISLNDQKRIFKDYYRASDIKFYDRSGTGLGLAIVKNIIDAHSGQIRVESKPGEGSTFIIQIPRKS